MGAHKASRNDVRLPATIAAVLVHITIALGQLSTQT